MDCIHYNGDCMIMTRCCPDKIYGCWRCHDEECEDHKLLTKRDDIYILICKKCGYKNEEITNQCKKCENIFGIQHCLKCMIFINDEKKNFFHCEECGICRSGKRKEIHHCKTCNLCVSQKKEHHCFKKILPREEECSICMENLFSSKNKLYINPCGHYYHHSCLEKYIETCGEKAVVPTCPLCKKSLYEPSKIEDIFDRLSLSISLSEECKIKKQNIKCRDCEKTSKVSFHPLYHKCLECHSYNTMLWKN